MGWRSTFFAGGNAEKIFKYLWMPFCGHQDDFNAHFRILYQYQGCNLESGQAHRRWRFGMQFVKATMITLSKRLKNP